MFISRKKRKGLLIAPSGQAVMCQIPGVRSIGAVVRRPNVGPDNPTVNNDSPAAVLDMLHERADAVHVEVLDFLLNSVKLAFHRKSPFFLSS